MYPKEPTNLCATSNFSFITVGAVCPCFTQNMRKESSAWWERVQDEFAVYY
jgi:hypothetical protein